jgi:hypothetical protein
VGVRPQAARKAIDMTAHKHFKQLVRARMAQTGESYTAARRAILAQSQPSADTGPTRHHLPGVIPGSSALRILLTAAGVRDPRTSAPLSEPTVFGIAGGIGIGIAAFRYEKADVSTFFLTGRHLWQDYLAYFTAALKRFGIQPAIHETASAKSAERQLRDAMTNGKPCIAWVAGYHVLTVYAVDDAQSIAWIGDASDEPLARPLADLAASRAAVKAQKNRLLTIPDAQSLSDLKPLVLSGIKACAAGLQSNLSKGPKNWSTLESLKIWAGRLHGAADKESWARMFPRGHLLWQGLVSLHDCIEHHHTGGGLGRPMFAEFLSQASQLPGLQHLRSAADLYSQLGKAWTELAHAALPADVTAFKSARELANARAELRATAGSAHADRDPRVCTGFDELAQSAARNFPLSEPQTDALLQSLQKRVLDLYHAERAALAAVRAG